MVEGSRDASILYCGMSHWIIITSRRKKDEGSSQLLENICQADVTIKF